MEKQFTNLLFARRTERLFKKGFHSFLTVMVVMTLFCQCTNAQNSQTTNKDMIEKNPYFSKTAKEKVKVSDAEWEKVLPKDVYQIARGKGTERAFSGKYDKHFEGGEYRCKVCGNMLFKSDAKFNSSCGWPSFFEPYSKESMIYLEDNTHGMKRVEVQCGRCESHLGHIFDDGPPPTGKRYCINSKVILFEEDDKK